jgi:hypothetical protein
MKRFVAATMIALALASGASAQTLQQRPQVQVTPVRPTIATANAGDIQAVRDENEQLRQELSELREAVRKFAVCQRALIARGASSGLLPASLLCGNTEDAIYAELGNALAPD